MLSSKHLIQRKTLRVATCTDEQGKCNHLLCKYKEVEHALPLGPSLTNPFTMIRAQIKSINIQNLSEIQKKHSHMSADDFMNCERIKGQHCFLSCALPHQKTSTWT